MALTDIQIKRAKPQDKPYKLNDGQGLSLLINPDGSKGWRFRFRFAGKARLMSFGCYDLVSLAETREKRDTARKQVASGIDPLEERKAQKLAQQISIESSFEAICREWHANKADGWTVAYREEIITGRAEYNPAPDLAIALAVPKQKHHPFLSAEELPHFIRDLEKYTGSIITKNATKIVMLTGVRTQEMRFATWDEVDLKKGIWEIPLERMKMCRPHIVPLSAQVIDLFKQLKPITGHYPYIFIGRNNRNKPISQEMCHRLLNY